MLDIVVRKPRTTFAAMAVICVAMLAFAILYLQNTVGLEPCPMCIVQRDAFILIAIFCILGACFKRRWAWRTMAGLGLLAALFGAFTAARQSWLQWYPPEFATCGRDLYGMIESFPLSRALPMIFRGSGDCSAVDWTFLGATIANWAFLGFVLAAISLLVLMLGAGGRPRRSLFI